MISTVFAIVLTTDISISVPETSKTHMDIVIFLWCVHVYRLPYSENYNADGYEVNGAWETYAGNGW